MSLSKILNNQKVQICLIIVVTFLAYSNIFQNQFLGDDKRYLENWTLIRDLKNIPQFFLGHEFLETHTRYRPVGSAFLTIYYQLFKENPLGYHIISLSIHIISTILVYFIALELFKRTTNLKFAPFITALLFGVHPINVEVVGFMIGSINLGYMFFLSSFLFYLLTVIPAKAGIQKSTRFPIKLGMTKIRNMSYLLSLLFAFLAVFSYEVTLTLPFIIIFADFCFKRLNLKKLTLNKMTIYIPYFLIAFLYLFIRYFLLHIYDKISYIENSFYLTFLVMIKVIGKILSLLVLPINLSINPIISVQIQSLLNPYTNSLNKSKILSQQITDLDVLVSIALILFLIFIAIKSFKKRPIISFCIGWFFISLLPVSNLLPQPAIFQERYAYLASYGYCLLLAYLVFSLILLIRHSGNPSSDGASRISKKTDSGVVSANWRILPRMTGDAKLVHILIFCIVGTIILGYGARTYLRNFDWKNSIAMWSNLASQIPSDGATNFYLGTLYDQNNQNDLAIKYFKLAIKNSPHVAESYTKLGKVYLKLGETKLASENFEKALSIYPEGKEALEELSKLKTATSAIKRQDGKR